jgi:hypothetical protein
MREISCPRLPGSAGQERLVQSFFLNDPRIVGAQKIPQDIFSKRLFYHANPEFIPYSLTPITTP